MGAAKRVLKRAAAGLMVAALGASAMPAWSAENGAAPGPGAAQIFFGGVLVNDARDILRDGRLSTSVAAREATILLQAAMRLDDSDLRHEKLLADAARAAGNAEVEREALRKVISADKGDLVSQVRYIEFLAGAAQTLEERARVFQAALDQPTLDAQIRSEMAVRLARAAEERGDSEKEKQLYTQALALNDLNVPALRGLVRLAAQNPQRGIAGLLERAKTLTALLSANPYQPDAWVEMARICEGANLHERAASCLMTAIEQMQMEGLPADGGLYLELATEQSIAGRRVEAFQIANSLAQLPDVPMQALIVAILEAEDGVPGAGRAGGAGGGRAGAPTTATQPARDRLAQAIHKRLVDMIQARGEEGKAAALADAAGVELSALPSLNPEVETWVDAYARLVSPEDPTLARLRGWLLYRQGKADAAKTILQKAAENDPLSQLGLARILIDAGDKAGAARQLQDLWGGQPTGLLAVQIAETARRADITLADTEVSKQMRDATAKLSPSVMAMHRQPLEVSLMSLNLRRAAVGYGEPAMMTLRITNTSSRSLPVGPEGVIKTMVGLSAPSRGGSGAGLTPAGIYAIEDLQRVYRLEPRQVIEATLRVDQGNLADVFERNPAKSFVVIVSAVTAPRLLSSSEFGAGLGGQALPAGDLERGAIPLASPADFAKFLQEASGAGGGPSGGAMGDAKHLARIQAAGAIWRALLEEKSVDGARGDAFGPQQEARAKIAAALTGLAGSGDALVRAMVARVLPREDLGMDGAPPLAKLAADKDPLVRLMLAVRLGDMARRGGDVGKAAVTALESQGQMEGDDLAKQWIAASLDAAKEAADQSTATQPAAPK